MQIKRKNRVLFIAYFYPPLGGGGVQRTVKFVKYLCKNSWDVIVLSTLSEDAFVEEDKFLLNEIPENVFVKRVNSIPITKILNWLIKIRFGFLSIYLSKLIFPDLHAGWYIEGHKAAERLLLEFKPDVIYSTSSPITSHYIAMSVKKKYPKVRWVADFRDPWSQNAIAYNFLGEKRRKIDKFFENKLLDICDHVIVSTESNRKKLISTFKLPLRKVTTITNGYDENDFENIIEPKIMKNDLFFITYIGASYSTYNPGNFVDAMWNLIKQEQYEIKFQFIGNSSTWVKDYINKKKYPSGFESYFELINYVPHYKIANYLTNSNLLFLQLPDNAVGILPGKIFEYLRSGVPILAEVPNNGEVHRLIQKTSTGMSVNSGDIKGIVKGVLHYYENWKIKRDIYFPDIYEIENYRRDVLTKKLISIFNNENF